MQLATSDDPGFGRVHQFAFDTLRRVTHHYVQPSVGAEALVIPRPQPHTTDPAALRGYTETYSYDEVGNLTLLQHVAANGNWTRGYAYADTGNRLLASSLPGDTPNDATTFSVSYAYDTHGAMTSMLHLSVMDWDHAEQLQHAVTARGMRSNASSAELIRARGSQPA